MLDPSLTPLIVAVMAMICAGGVAWVFLYPLLSGDRKREQRLETVRTMETATTRRVTREAQTATRQRSKKVADTLKDLEAKSKRDKGRVPIRTMLERAGLNMTPRMFYVYSVIAALVFAVIGLIVIGMPLGALAFAIVGGVGLPRWLLGFLTKRRKKKFLEELPNAIDVIVRGVKAGLPLNDCLRMIAAEAQEPLRSEFRELVESQTIGVQASEAIQRMYDRIPLPEVNFFAITIAIQSQSGGNLAEALGNLSKVLRERKKMRNKITSVSMEAKSSAAIIGCLPPAVMLLVYITTPDYIALLWTERLGQIMIGCSLLWMFMGVMVMRKMINFDF